MEKKDEVDTIISGDLKKLKEKYKVIP